MIFNLIQIIFLLSTLLGAIGLIIIIYSRSSEAKKSRLFILTLILVIGYIISHSIHFLFMQSGDVTILDNSCHSFLLMIIVTLTYFTWNFPQPKIMGIFRTLGILVPSLTLLFLLWSGTLIRESHAHHKMFSAEYTQYYPIFLIWHVFLIGLNIFWLGKKYNSEKEKQFKQQILVFLTGLIITNLASFIFGLFLPWFLGFYFLVEISPLAFLVGVILFTAVAVGKYNMFPATFGKVHNFSITRKIVLSAVVLVPIIILLVQIPLIRILFNLNSATEISRFFMISVLGGIVVSISMAFVIIKIISNPLNKLKSKTLEIEKGSYGIKLDFNTADEIGELAEAFNSMSDTLKNNSIELKNKENRISLLLNAFEKSSAAIAIVNDNFEIVESNLQFSEITGKKKSEILNKSISEIQFLDSLDGSFELIKNELKLNNKFKDEVQVNNRTLLISVTPSSAELGSSGYLFIEVDITEQKNLEKQLLNSEKLAALGKMAAVLAHEIKTPLTSIKLNADIFAETIQLKDEEKENLEIMKTEISRLDALVKDVLQFSRQMELDFSQVNLHELMEDIYHQLKSKLINKNIMLINNSHRVDLYADRHKLKQVFLNLIENSIDSITGNGEIEVSSSVELKQIKICISDTGKGVSPDVKIFEPFITTKPSGTGLGLSIANKIIEQHKGQIRLVSSEPATIDKSGKTIFEVVLPLSGESRV